MFSEFQIEILDRANPEILSCSCFWQDISAKILYTHNISLALEPPTTVLSAANRLFIIFTLPSAHKSVILHWIVTHFLREGHDKLPAIFGR